MRAGRRNKRITIRGYTKSYNALNEQIKTWFTVATIWASINPVSGREIFIGEKLSENISTKIEIRYRTDVKPYYKIKHGNTIYQIESIINPGQEYRDLILACNEVGDQDIDA